MTVELNELLSVGDWIEFDFFGELKRGKITTVGDHGYWIDIGSMYGTSSIRCPFGKARKLDR